MRRGILRLICCGGRDGAESGVLFKGGEALEKLCRMDTVLVDKTGTITQARPSVTQILAAREFSVDAVLCWASAVERVSEHPLAEAIVTAAVERAVVASPPSKFEALPGLGAVAVVDRRRVLVGNQRLLESRSVPVDSLLVSAERLATEGATPVFVAVNGLPAGVIASRRAKRRPGQPDVAGHGFSGPAHGHGTETRCCF